MSNATILDALERARALARENLADVTSTHAITITFGEDKPPHLAGVERRCLVPIYLARVADAERVGLDASADREHVARLESPDERRMPVLFSAPRVGLVELVWLRADAAIEGWTSEGLAEHLAARLVA